MQTLLCRKVPAEDGVNLATDVYLPDGPEPFSAVIVRTPYHRVGLQGTAHQFTKRGYAFVAQDCRGKYDSDERNRQRLRKPTTCESLSDG